MIGNFESRRRIGLGTAYLVLIALAVSPLLWVSVPALIDYPNHLARMWILTHPDLPALATNYEANWRVVPNLAMELIVPGLAIFMSVEAAGRVFIAATFMLLVLGTVALRRAMHGKVGPMPLLSLLFLFNAALFWGFLNYLFGLGVAFLAFAFWLSTSRWRPDLRLASFAVIAALLLLLHLFALGLYGLLVVAYEAWIWWRERPRRLGRLVTHCIRFIQFGPAVLLWLSGPQVDSAAEIHYGEPIRKLYAAMAPFALGFPPALLPWITLALGLCAVLSVHRRYGIGLAPAMRWPLLAVTAAALVMPFSLHGSFFADYRLPVALPFLVIAAARIEPGGRPVLGVMALSALLIFGVRIWATTILWRHTDHSIAEFRTLDSSIAEGARLLVFRDPMPLDWRWPETDPSDWILPDLQSFNQLGMFAIIDRGAFVPGLFTEWTSVRPTARNRVLAQFPCGQDARGQPVSDQPAARDPVQRCQNLESFDYLLWIDFGRRSQPKPAYLQAVASGSYFTIYRIAQTKTGQTGSSERAPP